MTADDRLQRAVTAALADDVDGHFERFVGAYQHRIYAFALNLTGAAATAEDVAQETFLAAYRALRGYDSRRRRELSLRSWLYTIALNRVRNLARSKNARLPSLDDERLAIAPAIAAKGEEPEEHALRVESVKELRAALACLPLRYRTAVVLRHIDERSYAEISAILGAPVGTVKSDVHRGLAQLRADLKGKE